MRFRKESDNSMPRKEKRELDDLVEPKIKIRLKFTKKKKNNNKNKKNKMMNNMNKKNKKMNNKKKNNNKMNNKKKNNMTNKKKNKRDKKKNEEEYLTMLMPNPNRFEMTHVSRQDVFKEEPLECGRPIYGVSCNRLLAAQFN
ncbi:uncharacterized protein [Palaemon carinicauda]|uniref:uncharacterized protein n=1 Tax=Palaemon carinicauda TaxID=392227 RepID=UPI0035B694FD